MLKTQKYNRYMYEWRNSKSSKPLLKRRAIAEHFRCGNTLSILIKPEKTNLHFCPNFLVGLGL